MTTHAEARPLTTAEERTIANTQRFLEQARQNAGVNVRVPDLQEKQRGLMDLERLLEEGEAPPRVMHDLYVPVATYANWHQAPATMTDEDHAQHCQDEHMTVVVGAELESRPCPRCQVRRRMEDLRAKLIQAGVDGRYLDVEWSVLERPAPLDRIARACENIRAVIRAGESLMLYSEGTGSGKTQAAMLIARAALEANFTAQVVNIASLAVSIRDSYNAKDNEERFSESQAIRRMAAADVLVIDDLGAGESDNASVERRILYLALNERQMHRRPTVVTTNADPRELAQMFGRQIMARLAPLEMIHVNHGRNFRSAPGRKSVWD